MARSERRGGAREQFTALVSGRPGRWCGRPGAGRNNGHAWRSGQTGRLPPSARAVQRVGLLLDGDAVALAQPLFAERSERSSTAASAASRRVSVGHWARRPYRSALHLLQQFLRVGDQLVGDPSALTWKLPSAMACEMRCLVGVKSAALGPSGWRVRQLDLGAGQTGQKPPACLAASAAAVGRSLTAASDVAFVCRIADLRGYFSRWRAGVISGVHGCLIGPQWA